MCDTDQQHVAPVRSLSRLGLALSLAPGSDPSNQSDRPPAPRHSTRSPMARPDAGADDEAPLLAEEPLRSGACSRELELREFRDRYVIRSLDGGAAFAVARSGGCIRPLSPGQPLNG